MYNTFKQSFLLRNTYRTNSILYYIKSLPILKKKISDQWYSNKSVKEIVLAISLMIEFIGVFIGKILYVICLCGTISFLSSITGEHGRDDLIFLNIFTFLTIAGGWVNCYVLEMRKDNYYAIILMRMDTKEVAVSNYMYFLIKALIGNIPVMFVTGLLLDMPILSIILMPIFIVSTKVIGGALKLYLYSKKKKLKNFQKMAFLECAEAMILFIPAYGLLLIGHGISYNIFYGIVVTCFVVALFMVRYILKFNEYSRIYKKILGESDILVQPKVAIAQQNRDMLSKKIDTVQDIDESKEGFAYLNHVFVKRHRKMLSTPAKWIIIVESLLVISLIVLMQFNTEIKQEINSVIVTIVPFFLFIMYAQNRGQYITRAMFINCDCQMLNFRFYRQPHAILELFKERLKTTVLLDLSHGLVFAIGLPLILFLSGGTPRVYEYLLLFVTICAMSIFFSVHNLVIYYVLQPYNKDIEMKNPIFGVVNFVVYIVCYIFIGKQLPLIIFGGLTSVFCIIYAVLAIFIAYKVAPKTFKIR